MIPKLFPYNLFDEIITEFDTKYHANFTRMTEKPAYIDFLVEEREGKKTLNVLIDMLPAVERAAVVAIYKYGMPYKTAIDKSGMKKSLFMRYLRNAILMLRTDSAKLAWREGISHVLPSTVAADAPYEEIVQAMYREKYSVREREVQEYVGKYNLDNSCENISKLVDASFESVITPALSTTAIPSALRDIRAATVWDLVCHIEKINEEDCPYCIGDFFGEMSVGHILAFLRDKGFISPSHPQYTEVPPPGCEHRTNRQKLHSVSASDNDSVAGILQDAIFEIAGVGVSQEKVEEWLSAYPSIKQRKDIAKNGEPLLTD